MRKSEIEALSRSLPDGILTKVKLPFVLVRRSELGSGAFTLLGDVYEEYGLARLLNGYEGTAEEFKQLKEANLVFYKPQVSELMRRFHSLVVVGFGLSE